MLFLRAASLYANDMTLPDRYSHAGQRELASEESAESMAVVFAHPDLRRVSPYSTLLIASQSGPILVGVMPATLMRPEPTM